MRAFYFFAVLALVAGCTNPLGEVPASSGPSPSGPIQTPAPGWTPPVAEFPAEAEAAAPVEVADGPPPATGPYEFQTSIQDGSYEHPRLDAAPEATIVWQNFGTEAHSVVSDDGTFAGSGPIAPGSEYSFTFLSPGDYAFHCRYHPEMMGLLVVR